MKTIIAFVALVVVCVQSGPLSKDPKLWQRSGKFEGDMILAHGQRNGVIDESLRWPDATILYEIGPEFSDSQKDFIKAALTAYDDTCVTVRERESTDENYVLVTSKGDGCYADVGFKGGVQEVNLDQDGCMWNGTVVHEFLHAVGFYHMQSNTNRDDYVTIVWDNIIEDEKFNFDKYGPDLITDFGLPYDYESIMHYERTAFSKNGLDTIIPMDPSAPIGEAEEMSSIDIDKINIMYGCV